MHQYHSKICQISEEISMVAGYPRYCTAPFFTIFPPNFLNLFYNFLNFDKCRLPPVLHSNHSPRWLNSSQWGQVNNNTIHMYKYYFRNPRNIQIYLDISSNPEILNLDMYMFNCRSRRGKPRGPPGSRELQTALKGKNHQKDSYLYKFVQNLHILQGARTPSSPTSSDGVLSGTRPPE